MPMLRECAEIEVAERCVVIGVVTDMPLMLKGHGLREDRRVSCRLSGQRRCRGCGADDHGLGREA